MKTPEELQAAIDEIASVCLKHRIVLVGTCDSEGIYGEISIFDANLTEGGWVDVDKIEPNCLRIDDSLDMGVVNKDAPSVAAIGEWHPGLGTPT